MAKNRWLSLQRSNKTTEFATGMGMSRFLWGPVRCGHFVPNLFFLLCPHFHGLAGTTLDTSVSKFREIHATRWLLSHSDFYKIPSRPGFCPTLLGELTTLPRFPSRLRRGYPLPIPHPPRRLWCLALDTTGVESRCLWHPECSISIGTRHWASSLLWKPSVYNI